MRQSAFIWVLTLVVGITAGSLGHRILSAQLPSIKRTPLLKTDLAEMAGKEGLVVSLEFAPGVSAGKHYHPAHVWGYILEGVMRLEEVGKPPTLVKPGETFYEPPKQVHTFTNADTTASLKFLVFALAEKGQPLTIPVP